MTKRLILAAALPVACLVPFCAASAQSGPVIKGGIPETSPPPKLITLVSFKGADGDGNYSYASLIADAKGNLFGTTSAGGTNCVQGGGCGTVFEITNAGFAVKAALAAGRTNSDRALAHR